MNKLVKGSIAGAAGIALLLGGAGTLAVWSDGATFDAGTVTSGELDLTANGDGAWDQSIDFIVPGDELTYTESFAISAVGDNLAAEITTNLTAITGGIDGVTTDVNFVVTDSNGVDVPAVAGAFDLAEGTYTVDAEIVVTFDSTSTAGMNESVTLNDLEILVTQVV